MKAALRSLSIMLVLVLCATAAFAGIRKVPYLLFEGSNTAMSVLWQTTATESNTLRWGTDTTYSLGQAADNPGTFTTATYNVSSRATTAASVAWAPAAWNTIDAAGTAQRTPDLKNVVQEIVNRAGWAQNNSMVFVITGTGKRTARAYDVSAAKAPKLVITYQ